MKKFFYVAAIIVSIISFSGCYADQVGVYERPPARRVIVAPAPYYYRPGPVIVERYHDRGLHRGWRNKYRRY